MLGIDDPWVAAAYVLCLASALLCLGYSWANWNRGEEEVKREDMNWAKEEDKLEDQL